MRRTALFIGRTTPRRWACARAGVMLTVGVLVAIPGCVPTYARVLGPKPAGAGPAAGERSPQTFAATPRVFRHETFGSLTTPPAPAESLDVVATPSAPLHGEDPGARLSRILRDSIGLSASQIAALERGEAVVKILGTEGKLDLAVFGIIAVDAPRAVYVSRLLDFDNSVRGPSRVQAGMFRDPATLADAQTLSVDRRDVADLKGCRPTVARKVKLPESEAVRICQAIDWSAGDTEGQASRYVRQRLVEYVTAYRARGDSAMVLYDDRVSVRSSDAFAALLAQSPYVLEQIPSLHRYLERYPHGGLDGIHEVFYWSVDDPKGLRPFLRVTHRAVYAPPEIPGLTVMAAKQIFASRYFEAGFDLTAVADRAPSDRGPGVYLLVLRRSRFDRFPNIPLINVRARVAKKARDQMRADLESEKAATEMAARQ